MTDTVLAAADQGFEKSVDRLFDFVRIPSISTDAAYNAECKKAARWLVAQLVDLGFAAEMRPTAGRPMVVASASLAYSRVESTERLALSKSAADVW